MFISTFFFCTWFALNQSKSFLFVCRLIYILSGLYVIFCVLFYSLLLTFKIFYYFFDFSRHFFFTVYESLYLVFFYFYNIRCTEL